jgi:hypothetical protein
MAPDSSPIAPLLDAVSTSDLDTFTILRRFADRTLPHAAWTHEAHLMVCWYAVTLLGADGALAHLRVAIPRVNEAMGVADTDHSGYHETLTAFYVGAVAHADAARPTDLPAHPSCTREAPLRHWTRDLLFSPAARRSFVEPDLAPLPWSGPV